MISILRQNENGNTESEFSDTALLNELFEATEICTGHCLPFIDLYGDTTFNQLQLPVLAQELRAAAALAPVLRIRLEALAEFVETAASEIHTYVKFVGD
jgi:hypothetical protein